MYWTAVVIYYFLVINILTFIIYGIDKLMARKHKWRISESFLICLAIAGGSIGAFAGMKLWHHKTLHNKFRYGIPLIIIVQIVVLLLIVR